MVRLEKILYERVLNTNTLNRGRTITTPTKWYRVNALDHMQRYAHIFYNEAPLGRLIKPLIDKFHYFEIDFKRDTFLQQGLTFEDKLLHHDAELRRNIFHEHMYRESFHPYHWILKAKRRYRYFKVEKAVCGFFVPEYIRSEAKTQTYADYERLWQEWTNYMFMNYFSDMTPFPKKSTLPVKTIFDHILIYGSLRPDAWERYFHNSRDQGWFSPEEVAITNDRKKFPYDLTTPEGKRRFEREITQINEKHPGVVAPEGQKFDFKKHYAEIGL